MFVIKTPLRVSFAGGGTDYNEYYRRFGGQVITTTIDKYCCVIARKMPPFLGSKYRIFWSKAESPDRIEDIKHPGVRGCLEYMKMDEGIEVNHAGDLPARSGLGSSSSFTVGMLHAIHKMRGEEVSQSQLAVEAIEVEQDVLKEMVGIQDQIQCAHGGVNHLRFNKDGSYSISPVIFDYARVESHLMLCFSGLQRFASEVAKDQVSNFKHKEMELREISDMVPSVIGAMKHDDMEFLGKLMDESWELKKSLSDKITSPELDDLYKTAMKAGAYGGKLLGAGGGGFFLFVAPPELHQSIAEKLGLICVPVKFEFKGSHVL